MSENASVVCEGREGLDAEGENKTTLRGCGSLLKLLGRLLIPSSSARKQIPHLDHCYSLVSWHCLEESVTL